MTAPSLFDKAEEKLEKDTTWIKLETEGDSFAMLVDTFEIVDGQFGPYPIVSGTLKDGTEASFSAGRSVLKANLTANPPMRGDVLSVKYLGEKVSEKSGNTYHSYKTVVATDPSNKSTAIPGNDGEW